MTSPANAAINSAATPLNDKPAIIATRQHCEADGVGLSHYILVDHAASRPAVEAPPAATPSA